MIHESRVAWVVLLMLGASVGAVAGVAAQSDAMGPPGPCQEAAIWHLHQAMRFSQHDDQAYHVGAAQAAQQLAALGDDCQGWQEDATRPGINGDGTATQADQAEKAQAQMAVAK